MFEQLFEFVLMTVLGLLFSFIGWRIWKKEQITLIHDYHYTKVSEKDKKPYTEQMGKACILMGIGMVLTGIVDLITQSLYGWVCFSIFFVWGLIQMLLAQKKYNGGLF